ncbi:hypothetical protein L226DRAFT_350882 [Lentinus tigrinus ALCF2SS1-7]|uniref:uncharacterized protein n=1 Tax=Lentinus tigrinus ALCF2SS1-7 TaxID=1328758 RepID=UPI00116632E7|nr:hypothetical protein L226DRAFT_350882 [Lentinus tigrinus ALCF2SS1-7]
MTNAAPFPISSGHDAGTELDSWRLLRSAVGSTRVLSQDGGFLSVSQYTGCARASTPHRPQHRRQFRNMRCASLVSDELLGSAKSRARTRSPCRLRSSLKHSRSPYRKRYGVSLPVLALSIWPIDLRRVSRTCVTLLLCLDFLEVNTRPCLAA